MPGQFSGAHAEMLLAQLQPILQWPPATPVQDLDPSGAPIAHQGAAGGGGGDAGGVGSLSLAVPQATVGPLLRAMRSCSALAGEPLAGMELHPSGEAAAGTPVD